MENKPPTNMEKSEIKKLVLEQGLTLTDLIDAVSEINCIVGVGFITLGDILNKHCLSKIKKSSSDNVPS